MVKERVTVNVELSINEYGRFTFKERLGKVEKETIKPRVIVPYAFPLSTSPNYCF